MRGQDELMTMQKKSFGCTVLEKSGKTASRVNFNKGNSSTKIECTANHVSTLGLPKKGKVISAPAGRRG